MLIKINYIALCLLGLAIPLSETGKQIGVIILILTGLAYFFSHPRVKQFDNIDILLVFFLVSVALSAVVAGGFYKELAIPYDQHRIFHSLYATLRVALIFFIVRYMPLAEKNRDKMLIILILAYLTALIWGEYNLINGVKNHIEIKGIGHVNHSSIFSGFIACITLNLSLTTQGKKRFLYILAFFITIFALLQSGSRATMIAFFCTIIGHFIINKKGGKQPLLIFFSTLILMIIFLNFLPSTMAKIQQGLHDPARLFIWKITITEWLKHNIFLGIGPNNSYYINPLEYGSILGEDWKNLGHSHNTFLTILLENGILGLFFYTTFTCSIIWQLFKKKGRGIYSTIGLDISIFNLVNSLANTTFTSSNALTMMLFWALALREKPISLVNIRHGSPGSHSDCPAYRRIAEKPD